MSGPGFERSLILEDGRVLEDWEGGDPVGRGMISHPGTPADTHWPEVLADLLRIWGSTHA